MAITDEQLKALVLNAHLIDQRRLDEIVEYAHNSQMSLTDAFLEKDVTSDQNLGKLIADFLKVPFADLSKLTLPTEVTRVIPEKMARKYKVITTMELKNY